MAIFGTATNNINPPAGFSFGSGETIFGSYGDTLANAKTARDAYFTDNPDKLAQYDTDNLLLIRLIYTDATVDKFQFNNRLNSAWVNTFDQEVASVDLSTHSVAELSDVTDAGAGIIPSSETNEKTTALITDGVTNKTANFTINAASEADHAGKTTVYSAAADGVCTLSDLADDALWASSKLYTIRTVVNTLTINTASGRLFDNASSSIKIKPGESVTLQGANIGGSRVFVVKIDSIHGLAKIRQGGVLVVETDEVNFAGNVVEVNDISGEANVNIRADQLFFTQVTNTDILNFNDGIWENLIADGKYAFGGNTATSSNMPPVKGAGAYTCYVWSIGRIDSSTTVHQRLSISFAGSPPEVFERSGTSLANAISNGWKTFADVAPPLQNMPVTLINSNYTLQANDEIVIVAGATGPVTITLYNPNIQQDGATMTQHRIVANSQHPVTVVTHDGTSSLLSGLNKVVLEGGINNELMFGVINDTASGVVGWGYQGKVDVYASSIRVASWSSGNFEGALTAVPMDTLADMTNDAALKIDVASNPTRVTAEVGCICEVGYNASVDSTGGSTYNLETVIRKNGTEIIEKSHIRTGNFGGEDTSSSAKATVKMLAGDYIELMITATAPLTGNLVKCGIDVKSSI